MGFFPHVRAPVISALLLSAAACQDVSAPQPLDPGEIREHLAPELAAQLTPEGRFPLAPPEPQPYPQITAEEATELAVAWARTYGPFLRSHLEGKHRQPIDFDTLEPVSPAWYAAAVYEPVGSDLHPGYRNAYGPHYLVYLGHAGEPVLSVSVAAHARARIENDELRLPSAGGNEFFVEAVRPGTGFVMPLSPEQAARIASQATGRRAAAVPVLLNPHRDYHPQHARWRIALERPVVARTSARRGGREVREVYVGIRGEIVLPSIVQEDGFEGMPTVDGQILVLRRRTDRPVLFERASFSGE